MRTRCRILSGEALRSFSIVFTLCIDSGHAADARWTLLDLTAGGSDRGPALGGDGVVNRHSMPKVGSYFSQLHEEKKSELFGPDIARRGIKSSKRPVTCPDKTMLTHLALTRRHAKDGQVL